MQSAAKALAMAKAMNQAEMSLAVFTVERIIHAGSVASFILNYFILSVRRSKWA